MMRVYHRLAKPDICTVAHSVHRLADKRLAEVHWLVTSYLGSRDDLEPIAQEALRRRIRSGSVIVVDVRPGWEFQAGHIAGAVSIPVDELQERVGELPFRKKVIAYGRGPHCVMAYEAVLRLRARGRSARWLVEGFSEWRAAGLPVEVSAKAPLR